MPSVYSTCGRWVSGGAVAAALALGTFSAAVSAQIPSNGVIYACVFMDSDGDTGWLTRLVAADQPCERWERRVQWNVAGPKGDKGDAGAAGMPGANGATGAQGTPGTPGTAGVAGAAGPAGPQGSTGPTGAAGAVGATGAIGAVGATGAIGAVGGTGSAGAIGPAGATGPTGATGAAGVAGATGAKGDNGDQGQAGPTGAQGIQGPIGPIGATGDRGAAGLDGSTGASVSPGAVTGQIVDPSIANLTGLVVHVPGHAFTVIVGADGKFTFDVVPPGTYAISVDQNGVAIGTIPDVVVANVLVDLGQVQIGSGCGPNDVSYGGHCYYLDGSNSVCDAGYSLASQSILTDIAPLFAGLTYKHTVSQNCCIANLDGPENWGMFGGTGGHCSKPGLFGPNEPALNGSGCTNVNSHVPGQLTLCGK